MVNEKTKSLIEEKMVEIPEYIKEAIDSSDWERKIFNIGRKYQLHIDELSELQEELELAMVGISDQDGFTNRLKSMGIPEETVDAIVVDINEQIFSHIRDAIKNYHEEEESPKIKDDEISDSEMREMKRAGVSFGDEPDEDEPLTKPIEKSTEKTEISSETTNLEVEPPNVLPKEEIAPVPTGAQVFKAKVAQIDGNNLNQSDGIKSKNFLDPYREPVE